MPIASVIARVSTDDQAAHGTSLDTQVDACLSLTAEHGYAVPDEYVIREAYSGATLERTGLTLLRQLVRDGSVQAVACYEPSRLSRDAADRVVLLREFSRAGVEVLMVRNSPVDDPLGRAMTFLYGSFAEIERRETRERTMRGKERTAR